MYMSMCPVETATTTKFPHEEISTACREKKGRERVRETLGNKYSERGRETERLEL